MRKKNTFFSLMLLSFMLPLSTLFSQENGKILGIVIDQLTGEALIGANITLKGTSLGTSSNIDGKYMLYPVPPGSYTLVARYVGYKGQEFPVEVKSGSELEKSFSLQVQAIEGEESVIYAQVRGQNQAINQQLASNTIVNVVSSERIHQLPDASAAAALSRLPGVSLMNGDQIVIRGIQAKLNQVLVNGIELPSTNMDDRSSNLGFISSNLLDGIEVIKVITPEMDANTIGGVVNLKLREAPTGFHSDVLAQGNYNSTDHLSDNYKFWVSVSDRFFDDKFGVFLQGNMDRTNGGNQQGQINVGFDSQGNPTLDAWGNAVYRPTGATFQFEENILTNSGGSLILDYKLPDGKIVLSNTYAGNLTDLNQNQVQLGFDGRTANYTANRNKFGKDLWVSAIQAENLFGGVKVDVSLSHSYTQQYTRMAHGANPNTNFNSSSQPIESVNDTKTITLARACEILDNADPTDIERANGGVGQWVGRDFRSFYQHLYNTGLNVSVPVTFSEDITATFKTGGKYVRTTRGNNVDIYRAKEGTDIYANPEANSYFPGVSLSVSRTLRLSDVVNKDFKKGKYFLNDFYNFKNGGYRWAIDESKYDGWLELSQKGWGQPLHAADSWRDDWDGAEQFSAGYLMGTFKIGQKLTILAGARYESYNMKYHAEFTYNMHTVMGNAVSTKNGSIQDDDNPVGSINKVPWNTHNVDRTDNNLFPGAHIQYKFNDWSDIRVAYTNGISRPNYTAIIPKIEIQTGVFNMGNPMLKPSTAQSYDILGTIHNNTLGLFSVGAFYKEIKNATYFLAVVNAVGGVYFKDLNKYSDIWLPDSAFLRDRFNFPISPTAAVSLTLNNRHLGYIRGIEIDWQTNFWYLPRPFNALVLNVNYTKSWSNTNYTIIQNKVTRVPNPGGPPINITNAVDTTFSGRLIQQANDVVNAAIGIDYKGFSGRLSFRMTGDVINNIGNRPEETQYTGNIYGWDFSLKQNLPIEGLSIALNGINIFHNGIESFRRYRIKPGAPITENLVQVFYAPTTFELNLRYSI